MQPQPTQDELAAIENPTGPQRRRRLRFACKGFAEGTLRHRNSLFRGEIRNFSETGCLVMTKAPLNLKGLAEVDIRFKIDNIYYQTTARVMRIIPGEGLGLEFSFADFETEELFRTLNEKLCTLASSK